jgi:hypothetical protein
MRDLIVEAIPDAQVALSSETRPKVRELGRFVTTALRAALLPVVGDYLTRLDRSLADVGCTAPLFIVKSNGGMMSAATARDRPEELIGSGPAGGVAAGSFLSGLLEAPSLIVTDVGGTSFEASLLEDGVGLVTDEVEIEWERPVITPMLDIRGIGAGGGSIAWIDDGGSLRVGPQSAGADPGPACYGRGGKKPTVTDANLVLGRIDPTLGGNSRSRQTLPATPSGRSPSRSECRCSNARRDRGDRQREHGNGDPLGLHRPRPRSPRSRDGRLRRRRRFARASDRTLGRHRPRARTTVRGRGMRIRSDDDGRPPRPRGDVLLARR